MNTLSEQRSRVLGDWEPSESTLRHSRASSIRGKSERFNITIGNTIRTAKLIKEASEVAPLLGPLKASMGVLITVLEDLRTSRKNKEIWIGLLEQLHEQIENIFHQMARLQRNDELDESIRKFERSLNKAFKEMESAAIDQKNGFKILFLSRSVSDQIQAVTSKLQYACSTLQLELLVQIQSYAHETRESVKGHAVDDIVLHAETQNIILEHRREDELRHVETQEAIKTDRDEDNARHAELCEAILAHRIEDTLRHTEIRDVILSQSSLSPQSTCEHIVSVHDSSMGSKIRFNESHDNYSQPKQNSLPPQNPRRNCRDNITLNLSPSMEQSSQTESNERNRQLQTSEVRTGGVAIGIRVTGGARVRGSGNTFNIRGAHATYADVHGIGSEVGLENTTITLDTPS
ncbi:hypothetical protein CPB86DRAFT_819401 [Serendipita vermifera]|nr:hypothetical protein CPB86DRAFT_819401 [Serendipita vermifera]